MKRLFSGIKYSFYTLSHPIRGFYEMRFENKGSKSGAVFIATCFTISLLLNRQLNGFIFNTENPKQFNIIEMTARIIIPLFLWCVANWSVTVLLDGEGRFVDIFMATAYSLLPVTITNIIVLFASHFLTIDEVQFISIIGAIGMFWTVMMLFLGILTIHQFTVTKNIFSIILTVIGMVFIIFLIILLASIFDKMFSYVDGIITEIQLRL